MIAQITAILLNYKESALRESANVLLLTNLLIVRKVTYFSVDTNFKKAHDSISIGVTVRDQSPNNEFRYYTTGQLDIDGNKMIEIKISPSASSKRTSAETDLERRSENSLLSSM